MLEVLKKEFGKKLRVEPETAGSLDYFETDFAKAISRKVSPADCVRIYRENLDMTQEELGRRVGVVQDFNRAFALNQDKAESALSSNTNCDVISPGPDPPSPRPPRKSGPKTCG